MTTASGLKILNLEMCSPGDGGVDQSDWENAHRMNSPVSRQSRLLKKVHVVVEQELQLDTDENKIVRGDSKTGSGKNRGRVQQTQASFGQAKSS